MKKFLFVLIALGCSALAFAKVNINTANADELTTLKGIGESKAALIIAYREEHGEFKSLDDLTKVKGIGEATLVRIREDISLEGKTELSEANKEE